MTTPSTASTVDELTKIFRRFVALRPRLKLFMPEGFSTMRDHLARTYTGGRPLSPVDHDLLFNIGVLLTRQQESITMSELSRALNVPLSTATRIVDWLVRTGYAERLPDPGDRRIVRVSLTTGGRQLYRSGNEYVQKRVERILGRFTPQEREELVQLLNKLVDTLEEEVEEQPEAEYAKHNSKI